MTLITLPDLEESPKPVRSCFRNTIIIWNECRILMRIMYKNKNQLRSWKPYKTVVKLQRCLKNIAKLELWLNCASVSNLEEVQLFIGYLDALKVLIEATKEVSKAAFYHHEYILEQALFVQQALAIMAIVARIGVFLDKVEGEIPREQNKTLLKIGDLHMRNEVRKRFGLGDQEHIVFPSDDEEDILVTSNLKEGKRPPAIQAPRKPSKKPKPQSKPAQGLNQDEIDDIFGSL